MIIGVSNSSLASGRPIKNEVGYSAFMQPNSALVPTTSDTVKFRNNKFKKMTLFCLGAVGALATAICTKQLCELSALRKQFSQVFGKDFSLFETNKLAKKYKEITKIQDNTRYEHRLREAIRADFGYKDLPIEYVPSRERFSCSPDVVGKKYKIKTSGKSPINPSAAISREELFSAYAHEFRHIKQHEIAYRSGQEAFFKACRPRAVETLRRQNPQASEDAIGQYIETKIKPFYDEMWGEYPKIQAGSKEYELAQKLNAAQVDYARQTEAALDAGNRNMYRQNFIEEDACAVEDIMTSIYKKLTAGK